MADYNSVYTGAQIDANLGKADTALQDVVDDTTPQLGGDLDANGHDIDMGTNLITDTKVGQWDTAYGWGNHATQSYATETYVGTAISNLIDAAPASLDTLNELAAALGDDANFATTVTNALALKANSADLGTAAAADTTDFATAAQGGLADSAVQPGDNVSDLTNDSGYLTGITGQSIKNLSDVNSSMTPSAGQVLAYDATNGWQATTVSTGGLGNVVEDTTPQLGGTLDANGYDIDMGVNNITDTKVGKWDIAYGWGDHASAGYLTSETYTGTVTSVAATVPTGLVVSGSPITSSGTLAISFDTGYAIPTTASQTNWDTAYGWGDHASAGYLTSETYTGTVTSVAITVPAGFAVTGSPITTTGSIGISFDTGYSLPTNASQTNWNTAYGWGNHAVAGYLTEISSESIKDLSDVYSSMTPTDGQVLTYDSTNGWQAETPSAGSSYTDSDVDTHLNTGTASSGEVLSWNGSDYDWIAAGGGGGITYVVKTANYTASAGEGILADTSGGAFTITLPSSPSTGDQVIIADSGSAWNSNNLTVGRNGSTIEGSAADLVLDIEDALVELIYDGSTWQVFTQIGAGGLAHSENFNTASSSSGTATLDLSTGNVFSVTLTENISTFTWSNAPASGTAYGFTLKIVQDSTARTITWPAGVDWVAATAPTLSSGSGDVDIFAFFTHDGGTTWYGFTAGQDLS